MFRNFIQIVSDGLRMDGSGMLVLYIVLALAFSALMFYAGTHYTQLWNKVYHVTPLCRALCGVAALVTFFATLGFIGLKNTRPVAEAMVAEWSEEVMTDDALAARCFYESYYAIRDAGMEDMRGFSAPENGGQYIPISHRETQVLVGQIYAGNACRDFDARYPLIGYFLKADEGVPSEIIAEDVNAYFRRRVSSTYPLERGFELAVEQISTDLQSQCGKIVRKCRGLLVLLFLLAQLIPFGLIGYLAYKELIIHRRNKYPNDAEVGLGEADNFFDNL